MECLSCLETKPPTDFPRAPLTPRCKHVATLCLMCIESSLESQSLNGLMDRLSCPECPELLTYDNIQDFGTPNMFERYKKHSVNELITKTFNTIVCPSCGEQMTQSRGTQYGITLCLNCNRQFCSRHKILWHYEHTCDEYETFLADPTFRSNAQIEAARREEYAFQDEQLSQRIKDADNHFAQSLMKEKEASQARRQAELERQARERRLAEERAAREAQQRREREEARKLSERKQREEQLTKRITKPCPRCQVEIVKDGGCDHMHCTKCGHHFYWSTGIQLG